MHVENERLRARVAELEAEHRAIHAALDAAGLGAGSTLLCRIESLTLDALKRFRDGFYEQRALRAQAEGRYESAAEMVERERGRAEKAEYERDRLNAALNSDSDLLAALAEWNKERARAEAAEKRIAALELVLRDFRDNYDCDEDAHRYGTTCRVCEARDVLYEASQRNETQPPTEVVAPMAPEHPVCPTCGDTHTMRLGDDREVPCTRCHVPCERCRSGAYCATAPCACECHQRKRGRK